VATHWRYSYPADCGGIEAVTITFVDRTTVQNALAALFSTALIGTGKPTQAVYAYQVADIDKKKAVVIVTSSGSNRRNPFKSPRSQSLIYLDAHVLVLYSAEAESWTAANSEAALNTIETSIDSVVADNNETSTWMSIDFAGKSEISPTNIGGNDYRYEVIPLVVEVRA
jgi:hypothetical protein